MIKITKRIKDQDVELEMITLDGKAVIREESIAEAAKLGINRTDIERAVEEDRKDRER